MKNFTFSFFLLFLSCQLFTQNDWQLFPKNQKSYWLQEDLIQMHYSDSSEIYSDYTKHYFGKKYKEAQFDTCLNALFDYAVEVEWYDFPLTPAEEMIETADFWYQINNVGDTTFFHNNAQIGFAWQIPTGIEDVDYFQISCTDIEEQSFLGIIDSVKFFSIQAYFNNIIVDHPFNEFQFELTKNYGFKTFVLLSSMIDQPSFLFQTPPLIPFNLFGLNNGEAYGFQNEFWDWFSGFENGDIFFYHEIYYQSASSDWFADTKLIWDSLTQVTYIDDTVKLDIKRFSYQYSQDGFGFKDTVFLPTETLSRLFIKTSSNIFQVAPQSLNNFGKILTMSNYDNELEASFRTTGLQYFGNCTYGASAEIGYQIMNYKPSLGRTRYVNHGYFQGGGIFDETTELICYRRNGEWSAGDCPDILSSTFNIQKPSISFEIFPNPVRDYLTIQLPKQLIPKNIKIQIFNSLGQVIQSNEINQNKEEINVSSLSSGTYFLVIEHEGEFGRRLFIKE